MGETPEEQFSNSSHARSSILGVPIARNDARERPIVYNFLTQPSHIGKMLVFTPGFSGDLRASTQNEILISLGRVYRSDVLVWLPLCCPIDL